MTDVSRLKDALIDDLLDRIENGETTVSKDGEVVTVKAPAQVLAVAAKVAKDFAKDANGADDPKAKDLSAKLAAYKDRVVPFRA